MSLPPPRSHLFSGNRFRIRYAVLAVLVANAVGALGFHLIEGWPLLTSLYVATQTVTTVGYGDVAPQSDTGRTFATIFMLSGSEFQVSRSYLQIWFEPNNKSSASIRT